MLYKKYLRLSIIGIKSLHKVALIPLAVAYILIPAVNIIAWKNYGIDYSLYINIIQFTQLFLPFFSLWWAFFVLREYVEGEGCELLYVYDKSGQTFIAFLLWLEYIICLIPLYTVYFLCFRMMAAEYVRIVCESLLMFGMLYFIFNLFRSAAITLIPVFVYLIINVTAKTESVFLFYSLNEITGFQSLEKYFIQALIGVFMIGLGALSNLICRKIGIRK